MLSPDQSAMIPEPPIPDLGSVTASALAEVLVTHFKLSAIASHLLIRQPLTKLNSASSAQ